MGLLSLMAGPLVGLIAGSAAMFAASVLGLYGAWLITEPDPSGLGEAEYGKLRRFIRVALALTLASWGVSVVEQGLPSEPLVEIVFSILHMGAGLVLLAAEIAKLTYFSRLALRIPDEKLSRRFAGLRVGYLICGAVVIVGMTALFILPGVLPGAPGSANLGPGATGGLGVAGCATGIAMLVLLILFLRYVRAQYTLGKVFRKLADEARTSWAAPTAGANLPPVPARHASRG